MVAQKSPGHRCFLQVVLDVSRLVSSQCQVHHSAGKTTVRLTIYQDLALYGAEEMISPHVSSRIHETVPGHNTMDGLYFHPSVATGLSESEVSHF